METAMGVWIDSRKAVVVVGADGNGDAEGIRRITTDLEKQLRLSSGKRAKASYGRQIPPADDKRERSSEANLQAFFGEVIAALREAHSIFIFGPGEAKEEFKKRLDGDGLGARVDAVESAGRMTDRQITAKARGHFLSRVRSAGVRL
jgi:hypothetical protein